MEMLKEELKNLYKAKPELVEEHKRLVDVLRSGSKKEQIQEAERQLKELKEMVGKADRCWEGYEPIPGKKPYEKGSCQPIKKEETSGRGWQIKIKGKSGYHDVKDVVDMGPQQHNSYVLHDGTQVHHDQVEDLAISPNRGPVNVKKQDFEKSNYGPKGMDLYNPTDNIKRKDTRTGEVREDVGQNKAVRQFTSAKYGTAVQQASSQAQSDKKKSAKNPVKSMADMSEDELNAIKARYTAKSDLDDKISAVKAKYAQPKEKSFDQKVKDIKQKYAQKPTQTNGQLAESMKMKYSNLLKNQAPTHNIQTLLKEVSNRQPTDAEFELLLDYNTKVAEDFAQTAAIKIEEENLGY
jgi:hypothetical protein